MGWRSYAQPKKARLGLHEKLVKIAMDNRCPLCQRKSALKYHVDFSDGLKTWRECRWCEYVEKRIGV